jgi:hypothetical protein
VIPSRDFLFHPLGSLPAEGPESERGDLLFDMVGIIDFKLIKLEESLPTWDADT